MSDYNPRDHYWRAEDGRLYSSSRGETINANDAAFVAWSDGGKRLPTVWPRDDDGEQTDAALGDVLAPYGLSTGVPRSVSRAQAKIALHRAGILDAVKTAVAGDPEMQIWFDDATTWDRDNPHVVALGEGALALSAAQIDALFVEASKIAA